MIERNYLFLQCADSTNTLLKERVRQSGSPVYDVICAKTQTGGRGRNGRSFASPPGGLYFSAAYPFAQTPEHLPFFTLLTGLAVCQTLEARCGPAFRVKWPNDIYCGDKKVCGILTELVSDGAVLTAAVGVGLNVSTDETAFPPQIRKTAASLAMLGFLPPEPALLMRETVSLLDAFVYGENALNGDVSGYAAQINKRSYLNDKSVEIRSGGACFCGTAAGISPDGALLINAGDGEIRVYSGTAEPVQRENSQFSPL